MGNITSRQAANLIDSFVLSLARTVDAVLRSINRRLSTFSSFLFSRVFGYDVVLVDDIPPCVCGSGGGELCRKESLVCGPGNVCIVPASRIQQRQLEKKRRSERRKRAEAAARGERWKGYSKVESAPSSPVVEMYQVKAPVARPAEERETVAERERGKLWVMGNVQPAPVSPPSPIAQRPQLRTDDISQRIQPRKSSKHAHRLLSSSSHKIAPVVESDETAASAALDGGHMMPRLHAPTPRMLPAGAMSLAPAPWEGVAFRHPFSDEPLALTSKAKHQLRAHQQRPKLSLDTQLHSPPTATLAQLTSDDEAMPAITRPPSAASGRRTPNLARKSLDAASLRSLDLTAAHLDVKTLATQAVKEEKGRKVWKDHVNKLAKEKCLSQQHPAARRYSVATDALTRVRTVEAEAVGARRGSTPGFAMTSGRSTPVLREASPLCR